MKRSVYEDGVNVPFLVAGPEIAPGTTAALGHAVDLSATLAALAGTTPSPAASDSVSLHAVFEDASARVRDHVICDVERIETNPSNEIRETCVVLESADGLVKGRFFDDVLRMTSPRTYYELESDPAEAAPLAPRDPRFEDEIRTVRELWRAYVDRP